MTKVRQSFYTTFNQLLQRFAINIEFEHFSLKSKCFSCLESLNENDEEKYSSCSIVCQSYYRQLQLYPRDLHDERIKSDRTIVNRNHCVICMPTNRKVDAFIIIFVNYATRKYSLNLTSVLCVKQKQTGSNRFMDKK